MGSGTLSHELQRLGELLVSAHIGARQAMQLHLQALGDLLRGLGTRSTRHVMSRADLLALEIIVHVAEEYRRRYEVFLHPTTQKLLPGFEM
jgi:hypothetical protein